MKKIKIFTRNWMVSFLYPKPLVGILYIPRFIISWIKYRRSEKNFKIQFLDLQPCLGDWSTHTPFESHYFYQGAWLARKLAATKPFKHVDIGSSVLLMSVLSATVETVFVDFRPLKVTLPGLTSISGDILNLPFEDNSIESLSCLHVIEHIGLGRYGDPIDPEGSVKAAVELQRVVKPGGKIYLSLPVGRERVCFNAHRVHAIDSINKMFYQMRLSEFSYVDDQGQFHEMQTINTVSPMEYGCGLFYFEKL